MSPGSLKLGNRGVAAILDSVAEYQRAGGHLEGSDIMYLEKFDVVQELRLAVKCIHAILRVKSPQMKQQFFDTYNIIERGATTCSWTTTSRTRGERVSRSSSQRWIACLKLLLKNERCFLFLLS